MDKRLQLVETALQLFYRHSVYSVGINDILQTAGVARKTLYHHFASKEELLLAALQLRDQRWCQWLDERLHTAHTGLALLDELFLALQDWFNGQALGEFYGCFFQHCSAEFSDPEHPVSRLCQQHHLAVSALLLKHLQRCSVTEQAQPCCDLLVLCKDAAIAQAQLGMTDAAERAQRLARKAWPC
ncbi:TetR family transcriptional regulator [Bacterioplanes sanyensis]|uniref:TetR family transcriptional regulator n=1 Tax=Bacterioplanes sanyensis TaxID=1249553 RepID=A0A222FL45_9GAMM|nr:TetR/AcrR family transcriptional regulator [Bacterioplanes sanyensis]ASP39244.1 TetR family transcriptional regulator [Bacterioplanes sanyensis]